MSAGSLTWKGDPFHATERHVKKAISDVRCDDYIFELMFACVTIYSVTGRFPVCVPERQVDALKDWSVAERAAEAVRFDTISTLRCRRWSVWHDHTVR